MNCNMEGMMKMILELFAMIKSAKVEIKKEYQVLMVNKTTSFKKRVKGKERELQERMASKLPLLWQNPKLDLSLKLSSSTTKGMVTGSGTTPNTWRISRAKWTKGIFDIHVIEVYFTSVYSNPSVFDTGSVAKSSNSKQELQNKQRLVKGEVIMWVGSDSKVDKITIAYSLYLRD